MGRSPLAVRPLSPQERDVLERTIRVAPADSAEMPQLDQLDSLQVVAKCQCGCASVDFRHIKPGQIPEVVAEATGETPSGETVDVLVFALGGDVVSLEIVGYGDDPTPLPIASTLRAWDGRRE
jgi:hypothetical protein